MAGKTLADFPAVVTAEATYREATVRVADTRLEIQEAEETVSNQDRRLSDLDREALAMLDGGDGSDPAAGVMAQLTEARRRLPVERRAEQLAQERYDAAAGAAGAQIVAEEAALVATAVQDTLASLVAFVRGVRTATDYGQDLLERSGRHHAAFGVLPLEFGDLRDVNSRIRAILREAEEQGLQVPSIAAELAEARAAAQAEADRTAGYAAAEAERKAALEAAVAARRASRATVDAGVQVG